MDDSHLQTLIAESSKGSMNSFGHIYVYFKDRVYNTCLSYLQNIEEAEEITQDVFTELHQSAHTFAGQSTVSTWIYRITVNKCLDRLRYLRRRKRFAFITRLFHPQSGRVLHDPPDFFHPGVAMERREDSVLLFRAIEQLPAQQQTAFILTQIEGLSAKEAADTMKTSTEAVNSLNQRARANLKSILLKSFDHR